MKTKEERLSSPHQSFVIDIKSVENHTWQGNITWVEGGRKESFRSALEMLRLMDSAVTGNSDSE